MPIWIDFRMKGANFKSPINGALIASAVSHPGVNAWARENLATKLGHQPACSPGPTLLQDRMRTALTMICGPLIKVPIVIVKDDVLAFVSDYV